MDDTAKTDKVFKYNTSGTLLGSWTIDAANKAPTGITIDPTNANAQGIADPPAPDASGICPDFRGLVRFLGPKMRRSS